MSRTTLSAGSLILAAVALVACGADPSPADKAAQDAAAKATPSPLAQAAQPAPAAPAAPPVQAIRTGAGPEGTQVSLVRAQVTGNVLTVELSYRPADNEWNAVYFDIDEVSVIDDATSQRYGVLKDNANAWMASPINSDDKQIRVQMDDGRPAVVWFKFPAPPATSSTVSINIPDVSPFDGVPLQR